MDKTYLPDLISELEQELLRLGYTKGSMTFYRRRWNQLMAYARADTELKRKALENAYPDLVDSNLPDWSENGDLMEWLSEL